MLRINGSYVPMDPRVWDADLDAVVNVGLGTGREDQKTAALTQIFGVQMQAIQLFGPQNPLAGVAQIRNTLSDMLAINGVSNADRYLLPVQPPGQPGAQQPEGAPQPPQGDPAQAMVQAETVKANAKLQSDAQRMQLEFMKAQMQDDRERDRMLQDLDIAMAQISAKYGMAIDTAQIKAQQAATQVGMPQAAQPGPQNSGGM
jgi:hypothetical protein